ncbi:MAG: hypothetical protein ACI9N9_000201 [Enterobacterales bacterium]|jgi:hypothetical protein
MFIRNRNTKIALSIIAALSMASILSEVEELNIELANIDLSKGHIDSATTTKQYRQQGLLKQVSKQNGILNNSFDNQLGVTTFSWHNNKKNTSTSYKSYISSKNITVSATPSKLSKKNQNIAASDYYLSQSAFQHGMTKSSIQQANLQYISDRGVGAIIAKYQQEVDGIEVFNHEINVMMDQELQHIASSGYFTEAILKPNQSTFMMSPTEAISIAFNNLGGAISEDAFIEGAATDKFRNFNVIEQAASSKIELQGKTRLKQVYFSLNGQLVPAFYTEITAGERKSTSSRLYSYVISAVDGKVLFRNNLTSSDTKTYRVFADATGQNVPMDSPTGNDLTPNPMGTADGSINEVITTPNLITLDHGTISTNDPWLVATDETKGNNVDAYVDITAPDGFGDANDARATTTSADTFDYSYDYGINSTTAEARNAAVVNLFYVNNFLHDWFYDNGFNEAAGNAQLTNFGRGGAENDPLLAEGQDHSGLNNANMSTPSDGGSPRMQMFLFQDGAASTNFNVDGLGMFDTNGASFGLLTFSVNGQLVQLIDDPASADPNDGCEAITNATELAGNIVVINRGSCNFTDKVASAEAAGAIAVLMINNETGNTTIVMGGDDASITIGTIMVGNDDGATILNAVNAGTVTATIETTQAFRDGTLDNGIVAHEWGHYISNRLVGNANGLNNSQGGGMGEGWGDFIALMMIVRESDRNISGNNLFQGTYNSAGYATANYYYGFRRAPYSTDMSKNALTFKHIENDVALPVSHSIQFGASGANNSEVHNAGEIWGNMLWEVYVSLLNRPEYSFFQAQEQMKNYLVAGMKMTPASPTFVEARDGILAAAAANDAIDFGLIFNAFAKRGMGLKAVAPNRDSTTNFGVVEDFALVKNAFTVTSSELKTDVVDSDVDADNALDIGDTGTFSITVENKSAVVFDAATAQISSTSDISFSNDGLLSFTNLNSFGDTASASLDLTLNSASAMAELVTLDITFPNPTGADPDSLIVPESFQVSFNANYDLAKIRSTDDIEVSALSMADFTTEISEQSFTPFIIASAADAAILGNTSKVWWGVDNSSPGTSELQLPEVIVAASGDFILSFYHYFNFEVSEDDNDELVYWDGGAIEVSIDGGVYQDVTAAGGVLSSPYNQTIDVTSNLGYGGEGGDETVTLTFPEGTLNGQTAKFRFLITTDYSVGGVGWLIDDISFVNAEDYPFSGFIENGGTAPINAQPTVTVTDSTTVTSGASVSISATGEDTDNDALTYLWTQVSGAAIDISSSNTSTTLTFTAPTVTADTTYVFEVVVNDGTIDSAAVQSTVIVEAVVVPPPPPPPPSGGGGGGGSTEGLSLLLLSFLIRRKLKK